MRKLTIDGVEWQYKIGLHFMVVRGPVSRCVPLTEVTGLDWQEIERGRHKRYLQIGPRHVKRVLLKMMKENPDGQVAGRRTCDSLLRPPRMQVR